MDERGGEGGLRLEAGECANEQRREERGEE